MLVSQNRRYEKLANSVKIAHCLRQYAVCLHQDYKASTAWNACRTNIQHAAHAICTAEESNIQATDRGLKCRLLTSVGIANQQSFVQALEHFSQHQQHHTAAQNAVLQCEKNKKAKMQHAAFAQLVK